MNDLTTYNEFFREIVMTEILLDNGDSVERKHNKQ